MSFGVWAGCQPQTGLAKLETRSLSVEFPVPVLGVRQPVVLTPGDRNGTHSHQDGLESRSSMWSAPIAKN